MDFHHFRLEVRDFKFAYSFFRGLNYECSETIYDPLQEVELILCKSDFQPWVELIKPINDKSPINNYINKNNEIIYHICYEVDNVEYILNEYFSMTKYKLSASQNMQYYLTIVLFHFITLPVWD
ncbi:MAG: hypothetical protein A2220_06130 [Ignavibacteria bacterium RIFOXYA2_FULL_35_10]|nr:MAG: hypothetical protein A2220_06130 [Ignavibacteria bacterium RIFOXYA2_FULL_35_10]